jgi:hypothetical protein
LNEPEIFIERCFGSKDAIANSAGLGSVAEGHGSAWITRILVESILTAWPRDIRGSDHVFAGLRVAIECHHCAILDARQPDLAACLPGKSRQDAGEYFRVLCGIVRAWRWKDFSHSGAFN